MVCGNSVGHVCGSRSASGIRSLHVCVCHVLLILASFKPSASKKIMTDLKIQMMVSIFFSCKVFFS